MDITEDETPTPTTEHVEQEISLTIADLTTIVQVIDVCSKRGAFVGEELEPVGRVYGKVNAILQNAKQSQ